jgi:hypothetical protein
MSHALATMLHRGRKAASNIVSACPASSREARRKERVWKQEGESGLTRNESCIGNRRDDDGESRAAGLP